MNISITQKLTPLQVRFIEEYLIDFNATGAAKRAGFSNGDYGRQLIHKPFIKEAIKRLQNQVQRQTGVTVASVIEELTLLYAIAKEKEEYSTCARVLELLGRHVGAFEKDNKQRGRSVKVVMNFHAPVPAKEAVIIEDIDNCNPSLTY